MRFLGQAPTSPRSVKVRGESLPRLVVRPDGSLSPGAPVSDTAIQNFASKFLFTSPALLPCVTSMFTQAWLMKNKYPTSNSLPENEKVYLRNMSYGLYNTVNNLIFPLTPQPGNKSPILQVQSEISGVSSDFIGRISSYLLLVLNNDVMKFSQLELEALSSVKATTGAEITPATQIFFRLTQRVLLGLRDPKYTLDVLLPMLNDNQLSIRESSVTGDAPISLQGLGQSTDPTQYQTPPITDFLNKFANLAVKVAILIRIIEIGGQDVLVPQDLGPYIPRWACKALSDQSYANTPPDDLIPRSACKDIGPPSCPTCPTCPAEKICPTCPPEKVCATCPPEKVCPQCVFDKSKCDPCVPPPFDSSKCPKCAAPPAAATDLTPKVVLDDKVMKPWVWAVVIGGVGAAGYFAWKKGLLKF